MYPVNTVLRWKDVVYRLIYRDEESVWLFPIENRAPSCMELKYHDFLRQSDQGAFVEIADPYVDLNLREPTESESRHGEENLKLITPLIKDDARSFEPEQQRRIMKEICSGMNGNERHSYQRKVKRNLALWWQRGQVPAALIPDWAPKKAVRDYKEKPGRKSSLSESAPALNDEIRKAFDKVCRERLLTPQHDSVSDAYSVFLHDWMKAKNVTESQSPTLYQFRYYYTTKYARADRAEAQSTSAKYEKDVRPLTGTTYDMAKGPGHIYEIDSTVDNVNLLNNERTEVVGRPSLYVVTDVYTGLIVGFDLSFEASQFKTAGDALFNAMEDKVAYCAKYGIPVTRSWWPAQGVPSVITADNAELTSDQALHLNRAYGISVNFTKTRRGDQKGTVENCIGLIQQNVRSLLKHKGLVLRDGSVLRKAGDTDSRGDAVLTLDDYRKLVIIAILIQNRRKRTNVPPGLPASIPARCLDIWKYYESHGRSMLRKEPNTNLLRLSLLKHYKPTCSAAGICVEGIRYLPEDEEYQKYFRRYNSPQYPENWQIVLDPSDVTHAWLQPDEQHKPAKYVQCSLAPSSSHLSGMTLRSATEYIKTAAETEKEAQQKQAAFKGEQRKLQEVIIREAEARMPDDQRTVRQKVKGIKTNRSKEIDSREAEAPRIIPEENGTESSPALQNASTPDSQSEISGEIPVTDTNSRIYRTDLNTAVSEKTLSEQEYTAKNTGPGLDMHFGGGNIDME